MSLLTNLVSYWSLDETSGTRADSHGSNNLTDINTVGSTTGVKGNAANFIRVNTEYLEVASNATLQMSGNPSFTIAAWLQLASKPALDMDLGKLGGATNDGEYYVQYLNFSAQDRFAFNLSGGPAFAGSTQILANSFGSPSIGTWYFVVSWYDSVGQTINIQVNNGAVDSASHTSGCYVGTNPFRMSDPSFSPNYWDGAIDEVGLWKRLLTPAEITYLYNGGAGRSYSEIKGATYRRTFSPLGTKTGSRQVLC